MSSEMVSASLPRFPERGYFGGVSEPRASRFQEEIKDLESQNSSTGSSSSLISSPISCPIIISESEMKKRAKDKRTKWVAYAIAFVVAGAIALVLGFLGSGVIKNQPSPIERNDARPWTAGPVMQPADENIASTVASDSGEPIRRNSEMDPKLAAWFDSPENRVNDKGRSDRAG